MNNEQKIALLSQAAFITIGVDTYRMDLCTEESFYYSDEESGEQYEQSYDEIDLTSPEIELYKLQKIEI